MFWDSVVAGLNVLTYWETYVAGLEYIAIWFIPIAAVGMLIEKSNSIGGAVGCLSMLFLPLLQVVAMVVFTLTLAPIIFGFGNDAAWSFPWEVMTLAPGAFFMLVGVLVVASIVLAFIPFLGGLQSLQTLVLGGIALVFVLRLLDSVKPGLLGEHVQVVPDFWFLVGLLAVGGFMSWIGMLVAAFVGTVFEMAQEGLGQLILFPFAAIFGFIPLFMYGAWLGTQIRGGF